ncbi:hypothetical protein HN358_04495 [Candidatus Uhrbacteria bacterium]|jgi:hypothetical protein|nr:hypothetical protein [Candidatus Uhrbacteria bacterium]MBT7717043.1 hypothetical protein [Candidatus Uhrbacteria bacterium]
MAGNYPVTGDQYRDIDRRMSEIKRQLNQDEGSPSDPVRILLALQGIVEGNFDNVPVERLPIIDCDAMPFIPNGWSAVEHRKGGQIEFDPSKIVLHLESEQQRSTIVGNELRKRLEGQPVMNANVLDHLLANTRLIPEDWKADEQGRIRCIYFWGTIYRDSGGRLYVRYLCWNDGQWRWYCSWLDDPWDSQRPAAILAS